MCTWLSHSIVVHTVTASRYLSGAAIPDPDVVGRLSDVLDWPYEELLESIIRTQIERFTNQIVGKYRPKKEGVTG